MKADYTEKMVGNMIIPNPLEAWKREMSGAVLLESVLSREKLRDCISLNINYLFSPLGYAVQCQYIGEMVIVLKVKNITI